MYSTSSTLSLFSTSLAVGIAFLLPFVPLARIGRRFFILMSLVSLVSLGIAILASGLEIGYLHLACAGFLVAYNVTLPRQPELDPGRRAPGGSGESRAATFVSRAMLAGAIVTGAGALAVDSVALARSTIGDLPAALVVVSSLSSAFLLGAALVTMVLGHWYLVVRNLSFGPLRRLSALLGAALLLRLLVAGGSVGWQADRWSMLLGERGWAGFFISDGAFVLARLLFGLLLPLVLIRLVWGCLEVESNQSATGILYVIVAFVLIGEIIVKHYMLSPGLVF